MGKPDISSQRTVLDIRKKITYLQLLKSTCSEKSIWTCVYISICAIDIAVKQLTDSGPRNTNGKTFQHLLLPCSFTDIRQHFLLLPQVVIIFPTASSVSSQKEEENGLLSVSHVVGVGLCLFRSQQNSRLDQVQVKCRLSPKEQITSGEEFNHVSHFIPHVEEKFIGFQPVLWYIGVCTQEREVYVRGSLNKTSFPSQLFWCYIAVRKLVPQLVG